MKPYTALAAAIIALGTSPALAQESRVYLQAGLGALFLHDSDYATGGRSWTGSYDPSVQASVAVGYRFSEMIRVEAELGVGQVTYELGGNGGRDRFAVASGIVAGYLDVPFNQRFVPYVGLGAGWAVYGSQDTGSSSGATAFGELGVSIPLSGQLAIVPGLRYTWMDRGEGYSGLESGWLPRVAMRLSF